MTTMKDSDRAFKRLAFIAAMGALLAVGPSSRAEAQPWVSIVTDRGTYDLDVDSDFDEGADPRGTGGLRTGMPNILRLGPIFRATTESVTREYRGCNSHTISEDGRTLQCNPTTMGPLQVSREVYVPESGDFVRYLDILENPNDTSITIPCSYYLYTVTGRPVVQSSDMANPLIDALDIWWATADFGFLMKHEGGYAHTVNFDGAFSAIQWSFDVVVPPVGRAAILSYLVVGDDVDSAVATLEAWSSSIPPEAAVGLEAYFDDIVNLDAAPPTRPRVVFTADSVADEGAPIEIGASVTVPAGGTATWSWDVDDDGNFGEFPNAARITVPAGFTDGPEVIRVGVRANSGAEQSTRYAQIQIRNLPPIVTSTPASTTIRTGELWTYQIVATDPSPQDAFEYQIDFGPKGLVVSNDGMVSWRPTEEFAFGRNQSIPLRIFVSDDDGDAVRHSVDLWVMPNRGPAVPALLFPARGTRVADGGGGLSLIARTVPDPELDPLSVDIEIDREPTFDSVDLRMMSVIPSGEIATVTVDDLELGTWFWRARSSDGAYQSPWAVETFTLVEQPPLDAGAPDSGSMPGLDAGIALPDASMAPAPEGGGCSVARGAHVHGTRERTHLAAALLVGAVLARRRRRARHGGCA